MSRLLEGLRGGVQERVVLPEGSPGLLAIKGLESRLQVHAYDVLERIREHKIEGATIRSGRRFLGRIPHAINWEERGNLFTAELIQQRQEYRCELFRGEFENKGKGAIIITTSKSGVIKTIALEGLRSLIADFPFLTIPPSDFCRFSLEEQPDTGRAYSVRFGHYPRRGASYETSYDGAVPRPVAFNLTVETIAEKLLPPRLRHS